MSEEIRDHGKVVTAPAGTPEEAVIDKLTGADQLPPIGQELGRHPGLPEFDPHEGREVAPGREQADHGEPMISTLVFMGTDWGGDFEDNIQRVVAFAEKLGLHYVTASLAAIDIDNLDVITENIRDEATPLGDEDGEDEEKF